MTTHPPLNVDDEGLRGLLKQADPQGSTAATVPAELLDRVRSEVSTDQLRIPTGRGRRWHAALMALAVVASLALASPMLVPGFSPWGSEDAGVSSVSGPETAYGTGTEPAAPRGDTASQTGPGAMSAPQSLVLTGTVLAGTDDVAAARDEFVASVTGAGGRITAESVITAGGSGATTPEPGVAMSDRMIGMPPIWPWPTAHPGIWLTAQVPADAYDEVMAAARSTGEVVHLQQSSADVGTQLADLRARIRALQASVVTLTGLLRQAEDIGDVVALEAAIAERRSELDGLQAQRRDLEQRTASAEISVTLMSPDDARDTVDPAPNRSWWDSFLAGLAAFWAWLGRALVITAPVILAGGIIWWARRRRGRGLAGTYADA